MRIASNPTRAVYLGTRVEFASILVLIQVYRSGCVYLYTVCFTYIFCFLLFLQNVRVCVSHTN